MDLDEGIVYWNLICGCLWSIIHGDEQEMFPLPVKLQTVLTAKTDVCLLILKAYFNNEEIIASPWKNECISNIFHFAWVAEAHT